MTNGPKEVYNKWRNDCFGKVVELDPRKPGLQYTALCGTVCTLSITIVLY